MLCHPTAPFLSFWSKITNLSPKDPIFWNFLIENLFVCCCFLQISIQIYENTVCLDILSPEDPFLCKILPLIKRPLFLIFFFVSPNASYIENRGLIPESVLYGRAPWAFGLQKSPLQKYRPNENVYKFTCWLYKWDPLSYRSIWHQLNSYCLSISFSSVSTVVKLELCSFVVHNNLFKGELHLLPKISMFCALSQNNQHLLEKTAYSNLFKELKNGIEILVGHAVFKL